MTAKCLAKAFVCLLTFAAIATAQGSGATIQGLVTDPKRAVIPEASVTATNTETNLQRTAITGESGIYVIPNLPPGRYRVQVVRPGFKTSVHGGINLVVGQQLTLNTVLEAGEITEQKTVTSEAPLVDVSTAQVAGVVGERECRDLPLNGRSVADLITLNPATVHTTAVKGHASGSS